MFNACKTTHIFCRPNCPPGRRTKPENRLVFPSYRGAIDMGYRPCLVCGPIEGDPGPWKPKKQRQPTGPSCQRDHRDFHLFGWRFRQYPMPPWPSRNFATPVMLNRLTRRLAGEMIDRLTKGKALLQEVLSQVVPKSDGVPLSVEERRG